MTIRLRAKRAIAAALPLAALLVNSCGKAADPVNAEVASAIAETRALDIAKLDELANARSQSSYQLFKRLMAEGGLEAELGGPEQADAALRALMVEMRRQMLGARADMPRLIKIADSGDAPGLIGAGASFFGALLGQGLIANVFTNENTPSKGSIGPKPGETNTLTANWDEGSLSTETNFTGKIDKGLTGTIVTKVKTDLCPKADGAVPVEFESTSSIKRDGSTAGANIRMAAKGNWYVTDDADFGKELELDIRVESAAFGGSRGANGGYVDVSQRISSVPGGRNDARINRQSSRATAEDGASAAVVAKLAMLTALSVAYSSRDVFQSGRCVKLNASSDPGKRSGVKPSTAFNLLAEPRSKVDGKPTGGTVTAKLSGGSSLDPADTKVPADARFKYTAPGEKNKKASVAFEARSKRGIGKATLDFDTMDRAYAIAGGGGEFRGTGKTCNLSEPFVVRGNANIVVKFKPTSDRAGTYDYTGEAGCKLYGSGTYTVSYNGETPVAISAGGPGHAQCPLGTFTRPGTEKYTLTPVEGQGCE